MISRHKDWTADYNPEREQHYRTTNVMSMITTMCFIVAHTSNIRVTASLKAARRPEPLSAGMSNKDTHWNDIVFIKLHVRVSEQSVHVFL